MIFERLIDKKDNQLTEDHQRTDAMLSSAIQGYIEQPGSSLHRRTPAFLHKASEALQGQNYKLAGAQCFIDELEEALQRAEENPASAGALQDLQVALKLPSAPLGLRERAFRFGEDRLCNLYPNVFEAVSTMVASHKKDSAKIEEANFVPSADQLDEALRHSTIIEGMENPATHKLAVALLKALPENSRECLFRRAFTALVRGQYQLNDESRLVVLKGYQSWVSAARREASAGQVLSGIQRTVLWLHEGRGVPQAAGLLVDELYSIFRQQYLSYKIAPLTALFSLKVRMVELQALADDPRSANVKEYRQLLFAADGVRRRLGDLDADKDETRRSAFDYLSGVSNLVFGKAYNLDISPSFEELISRHDSLSEFTQKKEVRLGEDGPLINGAGLSTEPLCSNDQIKDRERKFYEESASIVGQHHVKEELADHFERVLEGEKRFPLYLYGPSRIGKTALAKMAHKHYFPGTKVVAINFKNITPEALNGKSQSYMGAIIGRIAKEILDVERVKTDGFPCRPPMAIIFDDIDHARTEAIYAVSNILDGSEFYDDFFGFPLDFTNITFSLTGNSLNFHEYFLGRVKPIAVMEPDREARGKIVSAMEEGQGIHGVFSGLAMKKIVMNELADYKRVASGIVGLQQEVTDLLEWTQKKFCTGRDRVWLTAADAVSVLATRQGKPSLAHMWWEKRTDFLETKAFRAYMKNKGDSHSTCRTTFFRNLQFSYKVPIHVAHGGVSCLFSDMRPVEKVFKILSVNKKDRATCHFWRRNELGSFLFVDESDKSALPLMIPQLLGAESTRPTEYALLKNDEGHRVYERIYAEVSEDNIRGLLVWDSPYMNLPRNFDWDNDTFLLLFLHRRWFEESFMANEQIRPWITEIQFFSSDLDLVKDDL